MPTCTDGYVTPEIQQFMDGRSIAEIAVNLHSFTTGACDASEEQVNEHYRCLQFYLDHWVASDNRVDGCIHNLICEAMDEAEWRWGILGK